jgi:hypothetical protein
MSSCGHDGWRAGCPECEREHRRALALIDGAVARAFGVSRSRLEIECQSQHPDEEE